MSYIELQGFAYLDVNPMIMQNVISSGPWPDTVTRYANGLDANKEDESSILDICNSFFIFEATRPTGTEPKIADVMIEELASPAN